MIRAFLCDTAALDRGCAERIIKETPALAGVIDFGSVRWLESAAAYILLLRAYGHLGYGSLPRVERTERGKPNFAAAEEGERVKQPFFSISHRAGIALVALSDEGECGADVEKISDGERMARISERFLDKRMIGECDACDCELTLARMRADGTVIFDTKDNDSLHIRDKKQSDEPYLSWTLLEAVLKTEGGGFADLGRLESLLSVVSASSFTVSSVAGDYALTVTEHI